MANNKERGILSVYDYRRKGNYFGFALAIAAVAAMVLSMLYPLSIIFLNGVKTNAEVYSFPPTYLPDEWVWSNYEKGFNYIKLVSFMRNTLLIFAGNLAVTVFVAGLASFSLSKLRVPYRKQVTFFFMLTLFIPPTTYIIPNFVNLKDLGLLNSFWALWLPAGASAFNMLLLKSFFDSLHPEIFESARMDGASEWRCFLRIAVPLSIPIFSTLAIFIFASAWNDWFWPSLVLHSDSKYPLSTAIYKYVISATGLPVNVRFAILTMVMAPPILVFLVFQRFIMRGLHLGGVKG